MKMKLSEVKQALNELNNLTFKLENGEIVPEHFHITEVGIESKEFIDCGGTIRNEKKVIFHCEMDIILENLCRFFLA